MYILKITIFALYIIKTHPPAGSVRLIRVKYSKNLDLIFFKFIHEYMFFILSQYLDSSIKNKLTSLGLKIIGGSFNKIYPFSI